MYSPAAVEHVQGWSSHSGHAAPTSLPDPLGSFRHPHAPHPRQTPSISLRRSASEGRPPLEESVSRRPSTATSSERRAQRNRERDPSWVPRPPNAFIIYRAEYSRIHAQSTHDANVPPTAEKTLSKRAAEAWRVLPASEKEKYKQLAEQERVAHAMRHPDYKYRPRRRQSRCQEGISRREQVESVMRRAAALQSSGADSESESSSGEWRSPASPASIASSSSPEPPDTPYREGSPSSGSLYDSRSSSVSPPHGSSQGYFPWNIGGQSASAPCLSMNQPASLERKTRSTTDMLISTFSPMDYLTLPDDGSPDNGSFLYFDQPPEPSSSFMSNETLLDSLSFSESEFSMTFPPTAVSPDSLSLSNSCPPSAGPLFHRRQRSSTTSAPLPSPLSVVTSSLSDWDAQDLPSVTVSADDEIFFPQRPYSSSALSALTGMDSELLAAPPPMSASGLSATPELDFDRTPRRADFPHNVQAPATYAPTPSSLHGMAAYADPAQRDGLVPGDRLEFSGGAFDTIRGDFETYALGLQEMGIDPSPEFEMFFGQHQA